jgi:hypothetical protein
VGVGWFGVILGLVDEVFEGLLLELKILEVEDVCAVLENPDEE